MKIFGRLVADDGDEVVETPVGEHCLHCDEPIEKDDVGFVVPTISQCGAGEAAYHRSCFLRPIVGSVGHQMRQCPCYGGDVDDPPGMTKREAAATAVRLYEGKSLWN